jgi:hypothetical protein
MEIKKPDISYSRKNVDFGQGFYTTTILEQAQKWCKKFLDKGQDSVVSFYNLDELTLKEYKILQFENYSEEWLDFIISCRRAEDSSDYDVVMGGVANDKVFNTVELFLDNLIDKKEALKRLRYEKPNFQIVFRNQKALEKCVTFLKSENV